MRVAAVTMVRDESFFLPIWLKYYSKQFGMDNLYIIDHGSEDGSCKGIDCSVVRLQRTELNEIRRAAMISYFVSALLCEYDAVVFADADEIIVPDPRDGLELIDYIRGRRASVTAGVGLALLHIRNLESSLSMDLPILNQRSFVRFHSIYCKPLIVKTHIQWTPGFHSAKCKYTLDRGLFIFHLKTLDYDVAHSELKKRRTVSMSDEAIAKGMSVQFRYDDTKFDSVYFSTTEEDVASAPEVLSFETDLQKLFSSGLSHHEEFGEIRKIPERFRGIF